ncbi:titin isoform X2 [Labrus bergylta]
MKGGTQLLLLLAALVLQSRCQQTPKVSLSPTFTKIYSGDTFYLRCEGSASQSGVKWYFNDTEQMQTNETWKIAVATPWHSGSYQCESNRQTSDKITINVLGYAPSASLIIRTGQPVMRVNESVILQLDNEDGLRGWHCEVYRGKTTKYIKLKLQEDSVSLDFQTSQLTVPETIFWCMNGGQHRSNQITVRTSEKTVSLEMYPLPAVVGESLTLRCLVWGTDQISQTTFYKDGVMLVRSDDPTYTIPSVTESAKGRYKCMSIFTYKDRTAGPHYSESSDDQDVLVLDHPPVKTLFLVLVFLLLVLGSAAVAIAFYIRYRKRAATGAIYEDVERKKGDNDYEMLGHAQREGEYDTLHPEAPSRQKREGEYEALKKEEMEEGVYHTVQMQAASGGGGEYEQLQKEGMEEGQYQSLNMEGAIGGVEGHEASGKSDKGRENETEEEK